MSLHLLFAIAACVCFILAAANVPSRIGLTPLGLLFLTLLLVIA